MKIHIQNMGDCQKCGLIFSDLLNHDITFTDDPTKCELLVVLGCFTISQEENLFDFWKQATNAKVLLLGDCPTGKEEIFTLREQKLRNLALSERKIDDVLPVDFTIEGCPPSKEDLQAFLEQIIS